MVKVHWQLVSSIEQCKHSLKVLFPHVRTILQLWLPKCLLSFLLANVFWDSPIITKDVIMIFSITLFHGFLFQHCKSDLIPGFLRENYRWWFIISTIFGTQKYGLITLGISYKCIHLNIFNEKELIFSERAIF